MNHNAMTHNAVSHTRHNRDDHHQHYCTHRAASIYTRSGIRIQPACAVHPSNDTPTHAQGHDTRVCQGDLQASR